VFLFAVALFATSIIVVISCGKSSSSNNNPPVSTTKNISIASMSFSPSSVTVSKGTVVKWTNNDGFAHTATSNDASTFDSGSIGAGASYSYTANIAGTFPYHCLIHGVAMSGTLVVNP
jgi:plastocyanin